MSTVVFKENKKGRREAKKARASAADILPGDRTYDIREAALKDSFCNYSYQVTKGVGHGDLHGVKGTNIVKKDLIKAFEKLNVHLAVIDDVFKHSCISIEDIDEMHNHDLSVLYHVSGIKMKGTDTTRSVILIGNKYVSASGRINLESPKILLDSLSSYKWYNELEAAVDTVLREVELYKEGKYEKTAEEESGSSKQMNITDMAITPDEDSPSPVVIDDLETSRV